MIGSTIGIAALMGLIVVAVEQRHSGMLTNQTKLRAIAIAKNIAAMSANLLLSYNHLALQQYADKAVNEEDISYVLILDKEQNIAACSRRPELHGVNQADFINQKTLHAQTPSKRFIDFLEQEGEKTKVMNVTVPVYLEDRTVKWGTVRIGLSLGRMEQELFRTRIMLAVIGVVGMLLGLGGATVLSRKITQPIESLVLATKRAAQGNLNQRIHIDSHDELGLLGRSFNRMVENLEKRTKELVEVKNHLDRIIESSPDAITVVDVHGSIITFNEAAEKLTGYRAEEVIGNHISLFYPDPSDFENVQTLLIQKEAVCNYETRVLTKEGKPIPISLSLSLIFDQEGDPIGSVGISRDLREIKQLQHRLFRSERMAATAKLAAQIAHEVSNPIYGIQNCIDLLDDEISLDNPKKHYLELARKEIQRVATLIRQMLDFHRPIQESAEPVNINQLLAETLLLEEKSIRKSGVRIKRDLEPALPLIFGAENQLKQVFYNIIINAREAMPGGGQLCISTRSNGQRIRIDISDTGKGISPENREHIFEPFFTTKSEVKGVGLGLAVSYGILQKHKGTIDVKSEPEKGTIFSITLPITGSTEDAQEYLET